MRPRARALCALAALAACLALPADGAAQQDALVPQTVPPVSRNVAPPGFDLSAADAVERAEADPRVQEVLRQHPETRKTVVIPLYRGKGAEYNVYYWRGDEVLADVYVDGVGGKVVEVWTGPQAATLLARGEDPPLGRALNRPYVWLPLALLFLLPFLDPRRPFRLLHLDLLVMLAFGVSQFFLNRGQIELSVPIVYPLLAYLLVRMLFAAFRPRPRDDPLVPFARTSWLVAGLVGLVVVRIVLNAVDSTVIDVGYASVVGADRIMHGEELYVANDVHGDTYGPIAYIAYIPFELIFPWDGTWGSVPAAHAAAITFDLLVVMGLTLLGARVRPGSDGRRLGVALAFAWAAYPFSLLALQANTNDALVAALVVGALLALKSATGRGLLVGLGTMAKFAPAALAPLFATGLADEPRRTAWPRFAAAFAAVCSLAVLAYLPPGGLRELYDTTVGFQLGRESPLSLWGLHEGLGPVQVALEVAAILLALASAFIPRRRDVRQVAALAAAVLVAVQLPAAHWLYFYLVWIAPPALLASMAAYRTTAAKASSGHMTRLRHPLG